MTETTRTFAMPPSITDLRAFRAKLRSAPVQANDTLTLWAAVQSLEPEIMARRGKKESWKTIAAWIREELNFPDANERNVRQACQAQISQKALRLREELELIHALTAVGLALSTTQDGSHSDARSSNVAQPSLQQTSNERESAPAPEETQSSPTSSHDRGADDNPAHNTAGARNPSSDPAKQDLSESEIVRARLAKRVR